MLQKSQRIILMFLCLLIAALGFSINFFPQIAIYIWIIEFILANLAIILIIRSSKFPIWIYLLILILLLIVPVLLYLEY